MSLKTDIDNIKNLEQGITNNKVSKFAYTDTAYTNNDVNGVQTYNINNEQNIPVADADVLQVNTTITNKGYRAQASSLTRMLVNHFFGRVSYNLNKINDFFLSFLTSFSSYLGQPNGVATLDENGRIPYSQLPESAVEYKGEWNASTNTPTLVDGTGTNGSMYYVSVGGTQNLGSGSITFLEGDRIIYNGEDEVWQKLSGGTVKTVNSVSPDSTGNVQLNFSNLDGTVANSQIADKAVTNAKIADKAVTNVKIDDNAVTNAKIADDAVTNAKFGDVLPISKGGTGANNKDTFNDVLTDVIYDTDAPFLDTDLLVTKHTESDGLKSLYTQTLNNLWKYIKDKISSVLGLTVSQYNGNANTATDASTLLYTGTGFSRVTAAQTDSEFFGSPAVHASYLIFNHGDGNTYYHQMIRMPFGINGSEIPQYQRMVGGVLSGWKDFITSETIARQSVARATTAGTADALTDPNTYLRTINKGTSNITPPSFSTTKDCYIIYDKDLTIYKFFFDVQSSYDGGNAGFNFNLIALNTRLSFFFGEVSVMGYSNYSTFPCFVSYAQNLPSGSSIFNSIVLISVPPLTSDNKVCVTLYFKKT